MKIYALLLLSLMTIGCAGKSDASPGPAVAGQEQVGNEGPNGGTSEAQEIARLSGELLTMVKQSASSYPEVDLVKFEQAVLKTKLFMKPVVILNGLELDASNNGVDEIDISQSRWTLKTERLQKIALLFHEYLGIISVEQNTYGVSNRVLNPLYDSTHTTLYYCDFNLAAMNVRYDSTSDLFFFEWVGVDEATFARQYGRPYDHGSDATYKTWFGWETCGNASFVRKKVGEALVTLEHCQEDSTYRNWTGLRFLDNHGLFFYQTAHNRTMTCYPAGQHP